MSKPARIVRLFFTALLAVYSGQADFALGEEPTSAPVAADAVSNPPAATPPVEATPGSVIEINPTSQPIAAKPANKNAGQSVTDTQVQVNDAGSVEIHVNDANLREVLRMLSLQSQRNIIASKEVNGTVTANLYNVTLREAMDAILHSSGFAYREKGNFIYVYTTRELADLEKAARKMETQVFHLYYTPASNAVAMIKPALSTEAQIAFSAAPAAGIDSTGTETGGNSHAIEDMIVVTDYTDNLDKVAKIVKEIDCRPQQVLIEATILAATLTDDNALGVDFSAMGGIKFDQILSNPVQGGQNAAAGALTNPKTGAGQTGYGAGNTSFTNQLPPGGLRVGYLTNNISVFVQALESVTNTTVLANPKVLALDKQKGYVHIGRSDGYQTTTVSSTTSTQTVQFLDSGTTLLFRPYVGSDGFIRMEVHPEDSSGGLTSANLPFKSTTEVTTNLMIKDGHTVVIGGLFRDQSTASRGQVPMLGNIPWLGVLFRQQQDKTSREEIIILLTPHIIKDESAYSDMSNKLRKQMEDYRVGVRKGMMISSRERLADAEYQNALDEMHRPNADRNVVMWHLDSATNLNPQFIEAIQLKQQVSGKQVTAADNSTIRSFVSDAILQDTAPANVAPLKPDLALPPDPKRNPKPTTTPAAGRQP